MPNRLTRLSLGAMLAAALALTAGCGAAIIGGAASTVMVANDPRTTGTVIEDQAIELKAATALGEEPSLRDQIHVNVTSYNQIVLLTGETPTEAVRAQVVERVRNVTKVRHVHDELRIAAPSSLTARSSDTLITAKVKTKLFSVKNFDATRVKVVTEAGTVFLMGLLTRDEADVAAQAAQGVGGVQRVVKLFEYQPAAG